MKPPIFPPKKIPHTLKALQAARFELYRLRKGGLSSRSKRLRRAQLYAHEVWMAFIENGGSALLSVIDERIPGEYSSV